jgi:3'(2'), 5'-bisphosphate nucleotidase
MMLPIPLDQLLDLIRQAGDAILEIYDSEFEIETKKDNSPLTAADLASHHLIVTNLEKLTPEIPILSEESAKIPYDTRKNWSRYWLIDPLDGTREFIKRNGEFTVNIALIEDNRPRFGAVYAPVLKTLYYGTPGQGASKQIENAPPQKISVAERCREPALVAGSRSHAGDSLKLFLQNLGEHELVSMGSSLKLCLVAEGKADIYPRLGPTSEWDTAAAQAVVEAAGGQVTTLEIEPLKYNTKESLLNPHFLVFGDASVNWSAFLD